MKKSLIILAFFALVPLTSCYEIVHRVIVENDSTAVLLAEIKVAPSFFETAQHRTASKIKDVAVYRDSMIARFQRRMKLFDTMEYIDHPKFAVSMQDSMTVIKAEIRMHHLKYLHDVNRQFWSGLVGEPAINLPAFPEDINVSMKGDNLPVFEIAPIAAKYQKAYRIDNNDIEYVDDYSDNFRDRMCTFSFQAPKMISANGRDLKKIENGVEWEYPALDLMLFGRTSFKPVIVSINYPYGIMSVQKDHDVEALLQPPPPVESAQKR
jgi:hypothetical protein